MLFCESGTSYTKMQGSRQRILGLCQNDWGAKLAPTSQRWNNLSIKMNNFNRRRYIICVRIHEFILKNIFKPLMNQNYVSDSQFLFESREIMIIWLVSLSFHELGVLTYTISQVRSCCLLSEAHLGESSQLILRMWGSEVSSTLS